jgi:hypothetical protein
MSTSYDTWKASNPADEWLGPEPDNDDLLAQIVTRYEAKPIPDRQFDWSAVTADYDLGCPVGYGRTEAEAINDLIVQIEGVRR